MLLQYHISITRKALNERFSPSALEAVLAANLKQDDLLSGQIGHNEYHYDNNAIPESDRYLEAQRAFTLSALQNGNLPAAWSAFGRLIHTAQDFYAHSNYVDLWLSSFPSPGSGAHGGDDIAGNRGTPPPPSEIAPLLDELVHNPDLHTGKLYYPWEVLAFIPGIKQLVIPLLPEDSHAHMHLDSPARGERFAYAFEAAVKRTRYEFDKTMAGLSSGLEASFTGLS